MKKIFYLLILLLCVASCGKKTTKYTITYKVDGEVVKQEEVIEGGTATEFIPTKEGYEFYGWDKGLENISSDIETNAVFEKLNFTVKYFVDEKLVHTEYVSYGDDSPYSKRPTKDGYTFTGWSVSDMNVKTNIETTALFEKKSFTVKFVDMNDNLIEEQTVFYGESAIAPEAPALDGYEFVKWDGDYTNIVDNSIFTAEYKKTSCDITYYVNGKVYEATPNKYTLGKKVELPILSIDGYDFLGWTLSPLSQTTFNSLDETFSEDVNLYAMLLETVVHTPLVLPETPYHFTGLREVNAANGTKVKQPILPNDAPSNSVSSYTWSSSNTSVATISQYSSISVAGTGYCIITGSYGSVTFVNCVIHCTSEGAFMSSVEEANTISIVNVTFKDYDGSVITTKKALKGGDVLYPTPPKHEGKAFIGWDKDNYNLKTDTTITAIYADNKTNNYVGKSFCIVGDSISTFSSFIPKGFASFYPYPTADVNDMNMTWWMRVINGVGGTLFVNNSYSGTCVADNSSNATKNLSRMKYCMLGGKAPDVILIFMGANDCASGAINDTMFDSGYELMLGHLRELCPSSEVVLLTLPSTAFYSKDKQTTFNNIIKSKATKYNLGFVDVSGVSLDGHKVDSAHPNAEGMRLVAEGILKGLIK